MNVRRLEKITNFLMAGERTTRRGLQYTIPDVTDEEIDELVDKYKILKFKRWHDDIEKEEYMVTLNINYYRPNRYFFKGW